MKIPTLPLLLPVFLLLVVLAVQIYCVLRNSRWLAYVIPVTALANLALLVLQLPPFAGDLLSNLALNTALVLGSNLPTVFLVSLCLLRRARERQRAQLEKMQVLDIG